MPYFIVRVTETTDKTYRVEADSEDEVWKLDPVTFTDDQLEDDEGGDISITDVRKE